MKSCARSPRTTVASLYRASDGTWNLAPVSGPAIPAGGFDSPKIATSYAKRRGWKVTRNPGLDD